jgi:uncharacterized repeat protein (TIGR03803 family)
MKTRRPQKGGLRYEYEKEERTMRSRKQEMTHVRRGATLAIGRWRTFGILGLLLAATSIASPAQDEQASTHSVKFTTLHSFDGTDGGNSYAPLVQATNGDLYGTTDAGGAHGYGTIFKISPSGTLTTLYSFCSQSGCTGGRNPQSGLVQATDGNFYGTTSEGGASSSCPIFPFGCGTVFKITASGTLTTLYSFCSQSGCADGRFPEAGLVQATDGNFYGTTYYGGASSCPLPGGCGTVFQITPSGTLTTLHSFDYYDDGANPAAGLVQAANGNLYGTTVNGGTSAVGTIFKITPSGTLTTLDSFDGTDGKFTGAGLVQATDGNFYGTTPEGGANQSSFCPYGCGNVFKITRGGTLTTLYSFCSQSGCTDGNNPDAGLVQATDGNLYGTTGGGGANGNFGTVFKITPGGTLTTLHSFDGRHGALPNAALVQDTNGKFYGTTYDGGGSDACMGEGGSGCGTVFSLSVGLGPFVETQPTSGKVGEAVKILGTNLTGATCVMFNGTAAVFKVVSSSEIATTVPHDATSGKVRVTTPHGTLSSNVPFRVMP